MATIQQITYNQIITFFNNRIEKTNILMDKLEEDGHSITGNTDIEIQLYFKYYFDVYTAVERTIRCIVQELSRKSKFIEVYGEPKNSSKPYLVTRDQLESIIDGKRIIPTKISHISFKRVIAEKVNIVTPSRQNFNITSEEDFYEKYDQLRNDRNLLAHGIEATNNVEFSESRMLNNLNVLYILLQFYKRIS